MRMFLRATPRKKDGKIHHYWSVVENRRLKGGRVAQRHVLYLGEINDAQRAAWCKSIAVLEEGQPRLRQMAIFAEQRTAPKLSCTVVHVKLVTVNPPESSRSGSRAPTSPLPL